MDHYGVRHRTLAACSAIVVRLLAVIRFQSSVFLWQEGTRTSNPRFCSGCPTLAHGRLDRIPPGSGSVVVPANLFSVILHNSHYLRNYWIGAMF
jgi:hypothetical protein